MNTVEKSAAADYVAAIRRELADLQEDELAEIIDDLTDHLEQVSEELGGEPTVAQLQARLGSAHDYAAELRAAAGLGEARAEASGDARLRLRRFVTWVMVAAAAFALLGGLTFVVLGYTWVSALAPYALLSVGAVLVIWLIATVGRDPVASLRDLPVVAFGERRIGQALSGLRRSAWGAATVEFVASLRPAWWLVRAWAVTQVVTVLVFDVPDNFGLPLPREPLAIVVLVLAVVASVWLGRRTSGGAVRGWPRLGVMVLNTVLVVATPLIAASAADGAGWRYWESEPPALVDCPPGAIVVDATCVGTEVPRLDGLTVGDARDQLDLLRLEARIVPGDASEDWTVTRQDPAPGEMVMPGGEVSLLVETCPDGFDGQYPDCEPLIEVIDVIGVPLGHASDLLQSHGFSVEVDLQAGNADGVVLRQEPQPGAHLVTGGVVKLTVEAVPADEDVDGS